MTALLKKAFAEASKLPEKEQDQLAERLLAELAAEEAFDQALAATSGKLVGLARVALAEDEAGETEELDPDRL